MSDVKNSIEIALKIIGADTKLITAVQTAFEGVSTSVINANGKIKEFQTALNSIKAPDKLSSIVSSLKELNDVKPPNITAFTNNLVKLNGIVLPSLTSFATQMKNLSGITPPDLSAFTTQITKLSKITIPSLTSFTTQMKNLSGTKIPSLAAFKNNLVALSAVKKLPDLTSFTSEIKKLNSLGSFANFNALITALKGFSGTKIPSITALVTGLEKLSKVNLSTILANLKAFNIEIAALSKIGNVNVFQILASGANSLKTALAGLPAAVNAANASIKNSNSSIRSGAAAFDSYTESLKSFIGKMKTVGQFRLISDALVAVKLGFTTGLSAITDYDQALKDLKAITGATDIEIGAMGETILRIASDTKFSADEIAAGMKTIGQAGFTAGESINTMEAVANLATGTLSDMSTSVDLVTTAMRIYNIDASESAMISDVFSNAVNGSKLTVDKLRTALNYVGPIARDSGVSFNELAAAMGTLANSGLRASTIGTGLRQVLAVLVSPTKALTEAAAGAGIALSDLDPSSNSLSSVLQNLNIVVSDSGIAFDIFGKRGASAALALSSAQSGFDGMLETVGKQGTAAAQAAIQIEGLGVSFKNLKDKFSNFAIAMGDAGLASVMKALIDTARLMVDGFTAIANSPVGSFIVSLGVAIAAITATIGVSLVAIASFNAVIGFTVANSALAATSLGLFSSALAAAKVAAMALISTPIGLAITALIAVLTPAVAGIIALNTSVSESLVELEAAGAAYANLSKQFANYARDVSTMAAGSDELAQANIDLRTRLFEVASEFEELTPLALAAAHSINAITGNVTDGSAALDAYNIGLENLRLDKLLSSGQLINEVMEDQGSIWSRSANSMSTWNDISSESAKAANDFSKAIANGSVSVKDISDYIAELDMTNLTSQQEEIIESYGLLADEANKALKFLNDTGQISLSSTTEEVQQVAEAAGFGGRQLEEMLLQISLIKDAGSGNFTNIIEKWAIEGTEAIAGEIKAYQELGGAITENEVNLIRRNKIEMDGHVESLKLLNELRDKRLADGEDYETVMRDHEKAVIALKKEASNTAKQLIDVNAAENIKAINKIELEYDSSIKEITAKYAKYGDDNAVMIAARVKEEEAALDTMQVARKAYLAGGQVDQKLLQAEHKSSLQIMKTDNAKYLEALALQESQGIITNEEFNNKKLAATVAMYASMLEEAKKYEAESPEGDTVELEKRHAATLKAEEVFHKASLTQTIAYNKDVVKAEKEATQAKLDSQKAANTNHLSEMKLEYIAYLESLSIEDSKGLLADGEYNAKKLQAAADMYESIFAEAQRYQDEVSELDNSDEYEERHKLTLAAEENFHKAKLAITINANKEAAKTEAATLKEKLSDEKASYTTHLAELKVLASDHVNDLAIQESQGLITSQEFNALKLASNVALYTEMLAEAERYRDEVVNLEDPDEYEARNTIVLNAQKALNAKLLAQTLNDNKVSVAAEKKALKDKFADEKTSYENHLADMKIKLVEYLESIAIEESKGLLTSDEYNVKKLEASIAMYDAMLKEAEDYTGEVSKLNNSEEYQKRYALELTAVEDLHKAKLALTLELNRQTVAAEKEAHKTMLADKRAALDSSLADMEAAHSKYINELAIQEASGLLSTEEVNALKLDSGVELYSKLLEEAKKYLDESSKLMDPEEWKKYNDLVIKYRQDLLDEILKRTEANLKAEAKAKKDAIKTAHTAEKTAFSEFVAEQMIAQAQYLDGLAVLESENTEFTSKMKKEQTLAAAVDTNNILLEEAKKYRDKAKAEDDPEWYAHWNKIVLKYTVDRIHSESQVTINANEERKKAEEEAEKERVKAYKQSLSDQKSEYDTHINELKLAGTKYFNELALQESEGLITAEEYNALKLSSAIDTYTKMLAEAKKYEEEAVASGDIEEIKKRNIIVLKLADDLEKAKLASKVSYNKKTAALRDDIEDAEKDLAAKLLKIQEDLADKIKAIDQEIVDNKKSAKYDILALEASTEEKIRLIKQKTMTDEQKQIDDKKTAYEYLREGRALLAKAELDGDTEALERGIELIKQSESIGGGLDSETDAVGFLKSALESLKDARNIKAELTELDLIKEKNEEVADAATDETKVSEFAKVKIDSAQTTLDILVNLEKERHDKEVANLNAENDLRLANQAAIIRNAELQKEYAELGEDFYLSEAEYIKARSIELSAQQKAGIEYISTNEKHLEAALKIEQEIAQIRKETADYISNGGTLDESQLLYIQETIKALQEQHDLIMRDIEAEKVAVTAKFEKAKSDAAAFIKEYQEGMLNISEAEYIATLQLNSASVTAASLELEKLKDLEIKKTILIDAAASPVGPVNEVVSRVLAKLETIGEDIPVTIKFNELTPPEVIEELKRLVIRPGVTFEDAEEEVSKFKSILENMKVILEYIPPIIPETIQKVIDLSKDVVKIAVGYLPEAIPETLKAVMDFVKEDILMEVKVGNIDVTPVENLANKFEEVKVKVQEVSTNASAMIKALQDDMATVSNGVIDIQTDNTDLDETQTQLGEIKDTEIAPEVSPKTVSMLDSLKSQLDGVDDMYVSIKDGAVHITNTPTRTTMDDTEIHETLTNLEKVDGTEVAIKPQIDPQSAADVAEFWMEAVEEPEPVKINVNTEDLAAAKGINAELHAELVSVFGEEYRASLTADDSEAVITIDGVDKKLKDLTATEWIAAVSAKVEGQKETDALIASIDKLHDKTVTITTVHRTVNETVEKAQGGKIEEPVFARTGKRIPGFGGGDIVPAQLEPGEWVIRKEAVAKYGDGFFQQLNQGQKPQFATGGSVDENNDAWDSANFAKSNGVKAEPEKLVDKLLSYANNSAKYPTYTDEERESFREISERVQSFDFDSDTPDALVGIVEDYYDLRNTVGEYHGLSKATTKYLDSEFGYNRIKSYAETGTQYSSKLSKFDGIDSSTISEGEWDSANFAKSNGVNADPVKLADKLLAYANSSATYSKYSDEEKTAFREISNRIQDFNFDSDTPDDLVDIVEDYYDLRNSAGSNHGLSEVTTKYLDSEFGYNRIKHYSETGRKYTDGFREGGSPDSKVNALMGKLNQGQKPQFATGGEVTQEMLDAIPESTGTIYNQDDIDAIWAAGKDLAQLRGNMHPTQNFYKYHIIPDRDEVVDSLDGKTKTKQGYVTTAWNTFLAGEGGEMKPGASILNMYRKYARAFSISMGGLPHQNYADFNYFNGVYNVDGGKRVSDFNEHMDSLGSDEKAEGGRIEDRLHARTGKRVPGFGGGDIVPAQLEPGEWVIRKEAVKKYGDGFMEQLNQGIKPQFATGGSPRRKVDAMIEPGEWVMGRETVNKFGDGFMNAINTGTLDEPKKKFATGGPVQKLALGGVASSASGDSSGLGTVSSSIFDTKEMLEELRDLKEDYRDDQRAASKDYYSDSADMYSDYADSIKDLEESKGESLLALTESSSDAVQDLIDDYAEQILDSEEDYNDAIADVERDHGRSIVDIEESRLDTIADMNKSYSRSLVDVEESRVDALEDIAESYSDSSADLEESRLDSIKDLNENYSDSLGDLEESRLDSIKDLNENYSDSKADAYENHLESLENLDESYADSVLSENESQIDALVALEESRADAITQIDEELLSKQKTIADERAQIEEDLQSNLLSVNQSTADKLKAIQQRGLSETEKAEADKKQASIDMQNAVAQLNEAKGTGDVESIDAALTKLAELQDFYAGMDDAGTAAKGVSATGSYLAQGQEAKAEAQNVLKDEEAKAAVSEADASKSGVNADNTESKAALQAEHAEKLSTLAIEHTEALSNAEEELKKTLADLSEAHKEALADLAEENAEKLADMAEEKAEALADLEEENIKAKEDLAEENAEKLADLAEENAEKLADMAEEKAESLSDMEEEHLESLADLEESKAERLSDMAIEHAESLADGEEEHLEALANLDQELAESMADLDEEHAKTLEDMAEEQAIKKANLAEERAESAQSIRDQYKLAQEAIAESFGRDYVPKYGYAAGGFISEGAGGVDDVPAVLAKGEFVQKESAVSKYGRNVMEMLNKGLFPTDMFKKFNVGGFVSPLKNMPMIQKFSSGGAVAPASSTVLHSVDFNIGGKSFGPFQGEQNNIDSLINELSSAKGRA